MNRIRTPLRVAALAGILCGTTLIAVSSGWSQEKAQDLGDDTEVKPVEPAEELRRERESRIIAIMTDLIYQAALAHAMLEIDEYDRVAGIGEASVKRLQLAAKGAASQYAEKQVGQDSTIIVSKVPPLATMVSAGGKIYLLPVPEKEGEDPKEEPNIDALDPATVYPRIGLVISEDSITWRYRERNGSSGWGRNGGLGLVTKNPIWSKAIDKNTSPEQRERVERVRQARLNKAATDLCVALLEAKLHLDPRQRDEVAKILEEVVDTESIVPNDFTNRGYRIVQKVLLDKEVKGLVEVLTEAQGRVWKHQLTQTETGNF